MALNRLTKVDGGGISTTSDYRVGIITATKFVGPIEGDVTGSITATEGTFSGNVTIGGTLTYEDVTNIDSVGIITARDGIHVGAGVSVVGVGTFGALKVGSGVTIESSGQLTSNNNIRLSANSNNHSATARLQLGSDQNFEIYHNASRDNIIDVDRGNLVIKNSGSDLPHGSAIINRTDGQFLVANQAQNKYRIKAYDGGAVELYYNNVERFETTSQGINVIGHSELDNVNIAGVSTFFDDVKLTVANGNGILLDKSANQLLINSGTHIRLQNNNEVNADDGKIGTALFASGLNIVGSQTGSGLGRQIRLFGDLLTNNIKPTADSTHSIGTSSNRFLHAYLDNLDVDGHTNLDNVSIAGVTTFANNINLTSNSLYPLDLNSSQSGKIVLQGSNDPYITFREGSTDKAYIQWNSGGYFDFWNHESSERLRVASGTNGLQYVIDGTGYAVWHSANDGSGSGLSADNLDGREATQFIWDYGTSATSNINTLGGQSGKHRWNASTTGRPASGQSNEYGTVLHLDYDGNRSSQLAWDIAENNLYARTLEYSSDSGTWVRFLTESDEGSGNGLDADSVDGIQASSFLRSDAEDTTNSQISFTTSSQYPININGGNNGKIVLQGSASPYIRFRESSTDKAYIQWDSGAGELIMVNQESGDYLRIGSGLSGLKYTADGSNATIWHSGNDGSGSGLDADTVDGIEAVNLLRSDTNDTYTGTLTLAGHIVNSGDSRSIKLMGGTTNSQPFIGLGEQNLYGMKARWDSSSSIIFDGFWNTSVDSTSNRSLGSVHVNNAKWYLPALEVSGTGNFNGKVDFQGDAAIEGGTGYGVFKGYTSNDNHFIAVRGIVANQSTLSISGGHQTTFVEHADAADEGFFFKSKASGSYTEIARIDGTSQMYLGGSKVWHQGNDGSGSALDADLVDGLHASSFIRANADDAWTGTIKNISRNETPSSLAGAIHLQPSSSGGKTGIFFNSKVNANSDAAYIWWYDDNNNYRKSDSAENGALVIGIQNDGNATSEDAIAIESSGDIFLNPGNDGGLGNAGGQTGPDFAEGKVFVGRASTKYEVFHAGAHAVPDADNTYDLGSSAKRFRFIFTTDLQLSNENTGGNEVDGTEGNWTLQEGEDDIFMINRKNGKRYKIKLEEV